MVLVDESVSLQELDEALTHAYAALKTDHFGNRMTWKKAEILRSSIDDLLDNRLELMRESVTSPV